MAEHRYWRILILTNNGGSNHALSEIQLRTSIGGADATGAGTPSASSEYNATYAASKAFDDNTATAWVSSNSAVNAWIKYDFGAGNERRIIEIVLTSRSGYGNQAPAHFDLQHSDDDASWTTLFSARCEFSWGSVESRTYNINTAMGVDFSPRNMTSNSAPSPYVASASSEFGAAYAAWKVFNVVTGSGYWASNYTTTGWILIDLGEGISRSLNAYTIQDSGTSERDRQPKAWTIYGSNNGSDFDALDSRSNQINWAAGEHRDFTLGSPSSTYRYFRISITENNGDGSIVELGELFYFSPTDVSTTAPPTTIAPTTISTTIAPTTTTSTQPPTTLAPTTLPTTAIPTTLAPTIAPTTLAPTVLPTTEAPTTTAPTIPPTTLAPTISPTTEAPTTIAPTVAPTTLAPTIAPTTLAPTVLPTTLAPTIPPTTVAPTTIPTTPSPTSLPPSTVAPSTPSATTIAPTTFLTSLAPTTAIPITICEMFLDSRIYNTISDSLITKEITLVSPITKEIKYDGYLCR